MKIRVLVVCLALLLSCLSTGCADTAAQAQALYQQFMDGEIRAVDKDGEEQPLSAYLEEASDDEPYAFQYIDMTGDGVEELCVHKRPVMCFFTVREGAVHLWHEEYTLYTRLLENGAFLYERHGGAPTNICYEYKELSADATVKFSTTFEWYDGATVEVGVIHPDTYLLDGQEVSQEEYKAKTAAYLSLNPAPVMELSDTALARAAAAWLGVPDRKTITYEIGEKFYWDSAQRYCREIRFYENGQQVAGATVDPTTGEPLRNIWNYESPKSTGEQLIEEIDGAYEAALKNPEDGSTGGMVDVAATYRDQWKQVADQYYDKIVTYADAESVWALDDLHRSVADLKTNWEQSSQKQIKNYGDALYAIYGGSLVSVMVADYEYDLYKEWALELVAIYENIPTE